MLLSLPLSLLLLDAAAGARSGSGDAAATAAAGRLAAGMAASTGSSAIAGVGGGMYTASVERKRQDLGAMRLRIACQRAAIAAYNAHNHSSA